ncbi:MAG: hypothetical protein ABR572_13635, partial [Cryomorphaceae bacterium]
LKVGQDIPRNTLLYDLVDLHYRRSDHEFTRGTFRVRGDVVDIYPAYSEEGLRITMWGDEIEKMQVFDVESGSIIDDVDEFRIEMRCTGGLMCFRMNKDSWKPNAWSSALFLTLR